MNQYLFRNLEVWILSSRWHRFFKYFNFKTSYENFNTVNCLLKLIIETVQFFILCDCVILRFVLTKKIKYINKKWNANNIVNTILSE